MEPYTLVNGTICTSLWNHMKLFMGTYAEFLWYSMQVGKILRPIKRGYSTEILNYNKGFN